MRKRTRRALLIAILLFSIPAFAQSNTVFISDNNGNQVVGTVDGDGNVFFHDNNGNLIYGTIHDGNVFLNTSKGQITFGTIRNGNVFLTDSNGNTTGTIRGGNIFLSNSNGTITIGTYDSSGNVFTSTTGGASQSSQQQNVDSERLKQAKQQEYEAGEALGRGIGSAIARAMQNHRANSFCKANPTSTYHAAGDVAIPCPQAPLDSWEQQQVYEYCSQNPGSWMGFGKHRVDCLTPPIPPNLKWAKWELKRWRSASTHRAKLSPSLSRAEVLSSWNDWKKVYCGLARPGTKYKDLDGRNQRCDVAPLPEKSAPNSQSAIGRSVEGLYESQSGGLNEYIRFYPDGTVIEVSTTADATPSDVLLWFHRPYRSSGTYQIEGSSIRFSIRSPEGAIDFQGQIEGTVLTLDSYSHINGYHGHRSYEYVAAAR